MTDTSEDRTRALIASQREYYDERAPNYGDASNPDRKTPNIASPELCAALIDEFAPSGDVLELACGPGTFTADLARHARSVTAVDSSPRMLERNAQRVGDPKVTYLCADVFDWMPDRTYDAVFFGCFLSHVPPSSFDGFWERVRAMLAPSGRVAFEDEDDRAASYDDVVDVDGVPVARRTLIDGREFDIVKVFWQPENLERRLRALGWEMTVRRLGKSSLFGVGHPGVATGT